MLSASISSPTVSFFEFNQFNDSENKKKNTSNNKELDAIFNSYEQITDLIKFRINTQSLAEIANKLKPNLFELKLLTANYLFNKENLDFSAIRVLTVDEMISKAQGVNHPKLRATLLDVLEAHYKISGSATSSDITNIDISSILSEIRTSLSYEKIQQVISILSNQFKGIKYIMGSIDESLKLEVGLMTADLLLTKEIQTPNEAFIEDLIHFLKKTISQFGAYAIINGAWQPDEDDTSQLVTNMRILSGVIEVERNNVTSISREGLKQLILS